jgi:translocation and assembly module TamB
LTADINLPLVGSSGIKATGTVAAGKGGKSVSRAVGANVIASFDDLDRVADFQQGVTQFSGDLKSNLRIGGTILGPVLVGNLSLKNGEAVLPGPGLALRELEIDIVGDAGEGIAVTGSVKSGGGTLSLEGQVNNIGPLMTGRISLSGQKVLLLKTPEAETYVSPVIDADLHHTHLELAGEVSIDSANIQLTSQPQTA